MRIAVLTFDGFNEIDSFVASYVLNRVRRPDFKAAITAAAEVLRYVTPVGQQADWTARAFAVIDPYL